MSVIVTSAAVYSSISAERPVAEIRRIGGNGYRLVPGDGTIATDFPGNPLDPFDSSAYNAAVAAADAFVVELERDPQATSDSLALKQALADLAAALARIEELEAKLAGIETVTGRSG
jgi:hypothetical protein